MNESDWKLYSALRPLAHERMCVRIMEEVERTVLDKSLAPYERIEASEERLKAGSKGAVLGVWCVPVITP